MKTFISLEIIALIFSVFISLFSIISGSYTSVYDWLCYSLFQLLLVSVLIYPIYCIISNCLNKN